MAREIIHPVKCPLDGGCGVLARREGRRHLLHCRSDRPGPGRQPGRGRRYRGADAPGLRESSGHPRGTRRQCLDDIVKLTTYLTERAHLDAFRRVRNRFFTDAFPPNTLLFVSGLAHPDYLVEIEAVAYLPGS